MLRAAERLLLGPGPSLISPRVLRALSAPMLSHLDPQHAFAFAVSGTGTSAIEVAVSNLVQPGTRVLAIVTAYFAERLAEMCRRHAVPEGVDEAAVRRFLLEHFNMAIVAGLGPLAGKIWRIGLMGTSSTEALGTLCLAGLKRALTQ